MVHTKRCASSMGGRADFLELSRGKIRLTSRDNSLIGGSLSPDKMLPTSGKTDKRSQLMRISEFDDTSRKRRDNKMQSLEVVLQNGSHAHKFVKKQD